MAKMNRADAEEFLYGEARLLDERRFDEWLKLFTDDGLYWVPINENSDPNKEPSILYDDALTREQRVHQLLHEPHYSQLPPSRTVRLISNVEVHPDNGSDSCVIYCNVAIFELRPGDFRQSGLGQQRSIVGRCEYRLRHEGSWRISLKKVVLIDRDLPIVHLPFIV